MVKNKTKKGFFPKLVRNPLLNDSIYVGLIALVLAFFGLLSLNVSLLMTQTIVAIMAFLTLFVIMFLVNFVFDFINQDRLKVAQELIGALFVALLLPVLVMISPSIGIFQIVFVAIYVAILDFAGFYVGRKYLK